MSLTCEVPFSFFSRRFSLRDLPLFFDALWRGDLSDIRGSLESHRGSAPLTVRRCSAGVVDVRVGAGEQQSLVAVGPAHDVRRLAVGSADLHDLADLARVAHL